MTALEITDDIFARALKTKIHPFKLSFFDRYPLQHWDMSIGRDNGYLYGLSNYMIGFALSREAWHFNLFWKKEPMVPATIILTDVSLSAMVEKLYAKPRFPTRPYPVNPHRKPPADNN